MKVYVITKGCYSDYHIVGVSLDKERAEEIVKAVTEEPEYLYKACVEEYDTDQFNNSSLRFLVNYDSEWTAQYDEYDCREDYKQNTCFGENSFVVYAKDKEHAIKIAQDMRAEYMAEKARIKI